MSQEITNNARDYLEDLELKGVLNDKIKVLSFCCASCRLIWNKLPENARKALKISELYIEKNADFQDLVDARTALWSYLGKDYMNFSDPKVIAVRAVICCLYEIKTTDEAFSTIFYVMDFCNGLEDKSTEHFSLLQEIFGNSNNQQ